MPWYKVSFTSVELNGKQYEEYEFCSDVLSDTEEQELFEQHTWSYQDPVGSVLVVDKLPGLAKNELFLKYKDEQTHAIAMLIVLENTPVDYDRT